MNELTTTAGEIADFGQPSQIAAIFATPEAVDPVIDQIREKVKAHRPDTSTKKGREDIASLAYAVRRSKTAIDNAGKELASEAKATVDRVNEVRRRAREALDELAIEARAPLDAWEKAEEERTSRISSRLAMLTDHAPMTECTSAEVADTLAAIVAVDPATFDEWQPQAEAARARLIETLKAAFTAAEKREAEAAELEALRKEKAEREAAEVARKAEEEAKAEEARQIAEKGERLRERMRQIGDGIKRAADGYIGASPQPYGMLFHELENVIGGAITTISGHLAPHYEDLRDQLEMLEEKRQRVIADLLAKRDAEAAEREKERKAEEAKRAEEEAARLEKAKEEAAQRERERIARETAAKEAEERAAVERRERNKKHRAKILSEIRHDIAQIGGEDLAEALASGRVRHVEVNF